MAKQITLAFSVATTSTIYTPAQAAAKLAAVPLYASAGADPVLGAAFGLTVATDVVSIGGVTYTGEAGGPFEPGETVTGSTSHATATVAVDEQNGTLYFVEGSIVGGPFAAAETITGSTSGATATVNNPTALGGPTTTTPGATRALALNMTSTGSTPLAPPPFPCRPTGPLVPPPPAPPTLPYVLTQTTIDPNTRLPVTKPAPAAVVAFYSTSDLDTDGVDTIPAIPAGSGAQIVGLSYHDTSGAAFTVYTKLMGKFPATVALGSALPVAEITGCFLFQTGAFDNSVGQITLCALTAPLPTFPTEATPADFPGLTDAAQLTIARPLIYLPPSYFALAQQGNSAPQLAGDFHVKKDSLIVLTTVSQLGVLAATNTIEFASQPGIIYEIASVSATLIKLTTAYNGLQAAEIAPAAEAQRPARSVSGEADRVVTPAVLVAPSQAAPPDAAHLTTLLAEFTLPQTTAPALTYVDEVGGPFTGGETVRGQKSGGAGVFLRDDKGADASGTLVFTAGSVTSGFVKGETVRGATSHATATVVNPSTLATNPLPVKLSGLYARALQLVLGAPVTSQPLTLV